MNAMSVDVSCIPLNVRGLGLTLKRKVVFTWLKKAFKNSFMYLQETHSVSEDEDEYEGRLAI